MTCVPSFDSSSVVLRTLYILSWGHLPSANRTRVPKRSNPCAVPQPRSRVNTSIEWVVLAAIIVASRACNNRCISMGSLMLSWWRLQQGHWLRQPAITAQYTVIRVPNTPVCTLVVQLTAWLIHACSIAAADSVSIYSTDNRSCFDPVDSALFHQGVATLLLGLKPRRSI